MPFFALKEISKGQSCGRSPRMALARIMRGGVFCGCYVDFNDC
jgi:hypothetical protein